MPKLSDREKLAKIESDQRNLAVEAETVRRAVRAQYGDLTHALPVEQLTEREFRELIGHAVRVGGITALRALKDLPSGTA
ncbi:hypothetical protein [Novosphingobium sp. BL-52-GroH]|uniref:hypothetical protein n=1 Tax=Novosphingobium sp. BL-52-GroH TaxID=3349877 RepID=UPI00384DE164